MSEIWDSNSSIEEKHSISKTPQINQLKQVFDIRMFDSVLNKLYNKQSLDEYDFIVVKEFLNGDYKEKYREKYNALVEYAPEELKKEYTIDKIKQLKVKNLNDEFINSLFSGNLLLSHIEIAYALLSKNNSFMEDKLIDERVKETLKKYITKDFVNKKENELMKRKKHNPLSEKKLMDDELKNEIIASIPSDYTKLEKSIYLYIKLCQILSYDNSYYVNSKQFLQQHEDFSNLRKITSQNPNAICYEFVTLYSELLEEIGIKTSVSTDFYWDEDEKSKLYVSSFKDNHATIEYNVDNIIISADSTISVLNGDLINAKMGNSLNGIKCENINEHEKFIFESALETIYSKFERNNEFKKYTDDVLELPLTERLKQLFNDITNISAQGVDFISYITYLKHKYFSQSELQWNISINFVGKNDGINQYPVVIFSVNTNDIINAEQDTTQYLYDTMTHKLIKYDNEELIRLFESELFRLEETKYIPGISKKIKDKRCNNMGLDSYSRKNLDQVRNDTQVVDEIEQVKLDSDLKSKVREAKINMEIEKARLKIQSEYQNLVNEIDSTPTKNMDSISLSDTSLNTSSNNQAIQQGIGITNFGQNHSEEEVQRAKENIQKTKKIGDDLIAMLETSNDVVNNSNAINEDQTLKHM